MVELNDNEAAELRRRLRRVPQRSRRKRRAQSLNGGASVMFTELQKAAVLEVVDFWLDEAGPTLGDGPVRLRDALRGDLGRP
jgi:hypothetical protein